MQQQIAGKAHPSGVCGTAIASRQPTSQAASKPSAAGTENIASATLTQGLMGCQAAGRKATQMNGPLAGGGVLMDCLVMNVVVVMVIHDVLA